MPTEFKDNSDKLFGREPDLIYLRQRAEIPGVTAVVAGPQMGKSWLLTELGRQLAATRTSVSDESWLNRGYLVGFHEAQGETPDLLLRAVSDLYARWLGDSSFREQAEAYYQQNKEHFIGRAGKAAATILSKLAGLAGPSIKSITEAIAEATKQLVDANDQLTSGSLQFKPLQADQARDLLQIVHQISGNPLILIFDQWEKSRGIKMEGDILDSFLRHLEDWPLCHIFVALRKEDPAYSAIENLCDSYPGDCEEYPLMPMHLEDETSQNALLEYTRTHVPAARDLSDDVILNEIAGYPCVVSRWVKSRPPLRTLADLQRVARDAHAFRYPEFKQLLPQLAPTERRLACRIVYLPYSADPVYAEALKPIVLGASAASNDDLLREDSLDLLFRKGVLEQSYPPKYGHAKRSDAARLWFQSNASAELPGILSDLILALGSRIKSTADEVAPYVYSLQNLGSEPLLEAQFQPMQNAVLQANLTLLGTPTASTDLFLRISDCNDDRLQRVSALLANGLFNTLIDAKAEDNLPRRDALLDELRALHGKWPDDPAVREWLATGLYNTLYDAKAEDNLPRRDALLDELRALHGKWPDDPAVREQLATGLILTFTDVTKEGNPERAELLRKDLTELISEYPEDSIMRQIKEALEE